jgi:hypothetical protein
LPRQFGSVFLLEKAFPFCIHYIRIIVQKCNSKRSELVLKFEQICIFVFEM